MEERVFISQLGFISEHVHVHVSWLSFTEKRALFQHNYFEGREKQVRIKRAPLGKGYISEFDFNSINKTRKGTLSNGQRELESLCLCG